MNKNKLIEKCLNLEDINVEEALYLYTNLSLQEICLIANQIRFIKHPQKEVSWIIDININITNVCVSQCLFCNFCRKPKSKDAYITTIEEYKTKIQKLIEAGGNQILLQGGFNPNLNLQYYSNLFKEIKAIAPNLKLHALSPSEIVYLAKSSNLTYKEVLETLINAGLDSLPGGGCEILIDRVREILSPAKANSTEWLNVMIEAMQLGLTTTATMMFGHIETIEERIMHLIKIRDTQKLKPLNSKGFIAFIPWECQTEGTRLEQKLNIKTKANSAEYLKMIAISRIMLNNIDNIQASWLTVGKQTASIALHAGANDLGSIMIEENVVASTGIKNKITTTQMTDLITQAGFIPIRRDQQYNILY